MSAAVGVVVLTNLGALIGAIGTIFTVVLLAINFIHPALSTTKNAFTHYQLITNLFNCLLVLGCIGLYVSRPGLMVTNDTACKVTGFLTQFGIINYLSSFLGSLINPFRVFILRKPSLPDIWLFAIMGGFISFAAISAGIQLYGTAAYRVTIINTHCWLSANSNETIWAKWAFRFNLYFAVLGLDLILIAISIYLSIKFRQAAARREDNEELNAISKIFIKRALYLSLLVTITQAPGIIWSSVLSVGNNYEKFSLDDAKFVSWCTWGFTISNVLVDPILIFHMDPRIKKSANTYASQISSGIRTMLGVASVSYEIGPSASRLSSPTQPNPAGLATVQDKGTIMISNRNPVPLNSAPLR